MIAFSVIVDVNNNSENLSLALTTITRQIFTDFELLIISDTSSTKNSTDIKCHFSSNIPFKIIDPTKNQDRITALNHAIIRAKGDLIAIIQEDNQWRSDFLAVMATALQDCQSAVFACSHCQTFSEGKTNYQEVPIMPLQHDLVEAMLTDNFIYTLSSVVFRSSLLKRIGLFDPDFKQFSDRELYLRALKIGKPIIVPLSLVRVNSIDKTFLYDDIVVAKVNCLTPQQQREFDRVAFTQKVIQKSLDHQNRHDLQIKLKLKTKFSLRSFDFERKFHDTQETSTIISSVPRLTRKTNNKSFVSLITTVYNRASYIAATINSVLAQTYPNFELIIWDDGSTDDSLKIVQDYAQDDDRIKIFTDQNRGLGVALIRAIAQANAPYLGLVDSDDLLHPEALAKTVAVLESNPDVGMVYTDHWVMNVNGEIQGLGKRCSIPYSPQRLLIDFMTFHFRLMRRDVYDATGGFDSSLISAEDYDLCLRLSEITKIEHLAEPLYYYRWHGNSMSTTQPLTQAQCSAIAINRALARRGLNQRLEVKLTPQFSLFLP